MKNFSVSQDFRSYRLTNIDMLRGLVIIIMAIDHVRDFFMINMIQDPMSQPDIPASIYFTRWITHFCAPVFVFLAGTSVGLMATRKSKHDLAAFLVKRGIWLIFVEVVFISSLYTMSPFQGILQFGGSTLIALQVIWAIGASMIVLAGFQYLGAKTCLIIAAIILLGHNALDTIWPAGNLFSGTNPVWYGLHVQSSIKAGPLHIAFVYPLLPWIGVMLLGYGTAFIFEKKPETRDPILIKYGLIMILAFIALRLSGLYGDANSWKLSEIGLVATIFDFMNVTKYPPSLLFLLITLGPMAILCGYADRMTGWLKDTLVMFGRVPFAFYLAHYCLIRLYSFILGNIQGFDSSEMLVFFFFFPKGYGVSLEWVYVIWALVIITLYPLCKWVAEVKAQRKDWWLSYL